ncbi:hypothetical protein [Azospirillum sp. SYSU D00513]|uniref:Dyp-type peroxidase n=1 Tax=Azospirillum sp. SYSU D00513 TaxID=2812561 RepID=UPI001A967933|nr:hypothetical protein [Azospirillum sp. SYSU D00513]
MITLTTTKPAAKEVELELADIQGNILTAYGRLGFPKARYLVLSFDKKKAPQAREFVNALRPKITTALRWPSSKDIPTGAVVAERPMVALNVAFTFDGLLALGVSIRTLRGMPDDFIEGMRARRTILGDDTPENPVEEWDPVWNPERAEGTVHMLVTLNARMREDGTGLPVPELDVMTSWIQDLCARSGGAVRILKGHGGPDAEYQDLSALTQDGIPCAKEHFGYTDGISDPVFDGQYPDGYAKSVAVGGGATDGQGNWRPLATGEFLLGWPDEAQEIPGAAMPLDFSRNGTFIAYRKIAQDVGAFNAWVEDAAAKLKVLWDLSSHEEAKETLLAKMAGRWTDGVPLAVAPDYRSWLSFNQEFPADSKDPAVLAERGRRLVDFLYQGDETGSRCPVTAHIRRANTRDMLDPEAANKDPKSRMGSALNNRRRILRRGLPFGGNNGTPGEKGIVMLAVCASLQRQFEFVQQQWINYGLDFNAGNDTCPIIGNHGEDAKFVIAADPKTGKPPFIAARLKQFVRTRGGDYFFVPSMTALRMIAMGVTDPT